MNAFDKFPMLAYNSRHSEVTGTIVMNFFSARRNNIMQFWIGLIAVLIMAGGLGGIYYLVIKQNATIGAKATQFLAVVLVLPLLLVLGRIRHSSPGDHRPAHRRYHRVRSFRALEGVARSIKAPATQDTE